MIEQELGLSLADIFSEISPEPVAAASLGKVYQARLHRIGQRIAFIFLAHLSSSSLHHLPRSTQPPRRRQIAQTLNRAFPHPNDEPLQLLPSNFQPHNSSNQLSTRRRSVTCTAVSIGSVCDDSFTAKSEISPEPVAAASLGKVYQARLHRIGQVVACCC
ncbi:hypothetical protein KIW84_032080 [Lathyrus oleraceus]|uniref:ABC1 atypical kinase-like domain-containing protein n=1 Tax=Pisum sativum TaxID=3888 RepID=A0A9D5AY92_PEA|nr:hypothetical protein KIW84_032080 [Pisum sativum]